MDTQVQVKTEGGRKWEPSSWRDRPIRQMPKYLNFEQLESVEKELAKNPALIFKGEANQLKDDLAKVAKGEAFLFHGGDCAESFEDFSNNSIRDQFRILLQVAAILGFGGKKPMVRIGRIAGQFAKPRSVAYEVHEGERLEVYRGDMINGAEFDEGSRQADPQRLLKAYFQSASTLNLLRAFSSGGYADLHKVGDWLLDFCKNKYSGKMYEALAQDLIKSLDFVESCGVSATDKNITQMACYTSHEGLFLPYEEALTRYDSELQVYYATSAHFLWIGDRTRPIEEAHVEFFKGIGNPIGVKCGPSLEPQELAELVKVLNPGKEMGRLTLIMRLGIDNVGYLKDLIQAVKQTGVPVIWCCDPMHGNTKRTGNGYKTRSMDDLFQELESFFRICSEENVYPGGIHLEMTGKDVTECIGGWDRIEELDLPLRYDSLCDPRLNASQAIELAFRVVDLLKDRG